MERVLVVDDDEQIRKLLVRILEREGYSCTAAGDLASARAALDGRPFDLLLCDVQLPEGSGLDLVEQVIARHAHMAALMVSGLDDVALAERALRIGAYGYVVKPFGPNDVLIGVLGALRHRPSDIGAIEASGEEAIKRLCIALEARDAETAAHISRMSEYCWRVARALDLPVERWDLIRAAAPMHDVGKVGVPDSVLLKPGPLTPEERAIMQSHAEIGYRILAGSRAALLQLAATIAWTHHERWDGSGYPRGLAGDEIPLEGRIAAVADVYDALTRDRVYRPRLPREQALRMMRQGRGKDFDPEIFDALSTTVTAAA